VLNYPSNPDAEKYFFAEITTGHMSTMGSLRNIEPVSTEWHVFTGHNTVFMSDSHRIFYQFGFKIQRKYEHYIWNDFLITTVVVTMSFTSFGLAHDALGDKLQLMITCVLTLVALKMTSNNPKSPRINYTDLFVNYGIAFLLLFMITIASFHGYVTQLEDELAYIYDLSLRVIVCSIWGIIVLVYVALVTIRVLEVYSDKSVAIDETPFMDVLFHSPNQNQIDTNK